jgi:pyridoxamine 5'-phosphate oxidase
VTLGSAAGGYDDVKQRSKRDTEIASMADATNPDYHTTPQAGDFAGSEEPFALFEAWFADATAHEPSDPNAFALATVDGGGLPNVRMVLLKGLDEADADPRGFVFYTNFESAKGRELTASAKAAMCFHWKSLRRQVRVRGLVAPVFDAEADAYFASRARAARGAWASQQSRPSSRFASEAVASVTGVSHWRHPGPCTGRAPHRPPRVGFWHDRPFRHERLRSAVRRSLSPGPGAGVIPSFARPRS